jgi:TIR domain
MSAVFISYARADRESARVLADTLARHGWSVWWDRAIPPGRSFDEVIEEALNAARCVVVLWSKPSAASDWVKNEAAEAARRKILVPVLIEDVKIPLEFRRVQAANLTGWRGEAEHRELEKLLESIGRLAGPGNNRTRAEPPHRGNAAYTVNREVVRAGSAAGAPAELGATSSAAVSRWGSVARSSGSRWGSVARAGRFKWAALAVGAFALVTAMYYGLVASQTGSSALAARPMTTEPGIAPSGSATARVRIGTVDGSAEVYEQGRRVGSTPFERVYPVGKRVDLLLRREGHEDERVAFKVREVGNEFLGYTLTPKRRR